MPTYRMKASATIDATQFNKVGDHPNVFEDETSSTGFRIHTLEGGKIGQEVTLVDWIATGVAGENWPIKPHIFEQTYELAA
jgi:hypothetical protein